MSDASAPSVMPGADAWSAPGGPNGVLVCHGFTGNPQSMRGLAEAFAAAGFTVELPRWPGHGTRIEDMIPTGWADWSAAAESAYQDLASRCERVVLAGLSMGGTLACWLASRHPEVAGLVAINAAVEPTAEAAVEAIRALHESGEEVMAGIGSDIADPDVTESAYVGTPIASLLSLFAAVDELAPRLADVSCPVLVITSRQDHVVPPSASDFLAERVQGPVERVWLERSYHVATLDYERGEIESRAVEFATKVTSA